LWLDSNGLGTTAQFAPIGIKHVIGKEELHVIDLEPDCKA
jgi:hypothetical protein